MLVLSRRRVGFLGLICIVTCVANAYGYSETGKTLYVADNAQKRPSSFMLDRFDEDLASSDSHLRRKRDISTSPPAALQKNISTWTTHLNDSHQQLMVHWVGEGSNVIICLARDSSPRTKGIISPSALFISYDYGKNFTNKTESFKLDDTPDSELAQLEKFFNHPKYPEFCVFVDSINKKLFYTSDNGRHIHRSDLSFHPSELAFDEEFPDKYVILDKVDSNRKLYLTLDGGKTFKHIQSFVKTFFWSSGMDLPKAFYVERWKPDGTSTVLTTSDPANWTNQKKLFEDAKDFQIKGDFMFATKQSKEKNTIDLYISHQRGPFFKAEFQTELDLKKFHIADVTDRRIFVSVMHTESLANLYVSEINRNFTQYNFVLSMEQILCYFPDGNWKDSWLEDVTEDSFTDLYRVEGLKGIYIASKVDSKAPVANIGPEHLISLITFDHGVTWSPVNPPTEDENGKPLNCHIENSCSLHLCQKFSQLYPVTRSASIMSSKSAPGIIMATGVMGKSLKGIPGVYMSRDAGLTWKRILKDYYFFNYGDHGGVLVAVKYFKSRGETRKILYSTNEGIEWNSYQFNAEDLRIYGLMTEPGENTTTFTMFGSANDQHQWIIITIDLLNTFPRNCTPEDYKFWSPSPPNSSVSCVLGMRDTFQRRLAHTSCYNGVNYDRPVKKQVCECSRRDFECAYGFMLSGHECVRNKSLTRYDPYEIPSDCHAGRLYEKTRGYRKIDGDVCTSTLYNPYLPDEVPCPLDKPQEFILIALRDRIARIDLTTNNTMFPVTGQKNIVAVEFDLKNSCVYWADIELDMISRQCFSDGTVQEVVVDTDLASIEGMSLDYIANVLYFVDGMRKKIEAVRTDISRAGRMRATILDSNVLSKPRGIAVHPKAGYLYWTDWDRNAPSVSRSNLDGTNVKKLFGKPIVQWPNGITIDQMSERIYWVDAMEDYIASADLEGRYFKRVLWNEEKVSHPFAVGVLKDKIYWDDWKEKSIFMADKDTGANIVTINDSFTGLMDLKVFAHYIQHGSNGCSYSNHSCSTLCVAGPGNTFSCLCPDGFTKVGDKCLCPNGMMPDINMICPKKAGASCDPDQFTCKNGMCITSTWRCDGNNDCGDLSDEVGCQCSPPMIPCDDNRCYLQLWHCDGDQDCADNTDEKDCGHHNCTEKQFQCGNGQCIEKKWLCDGDNDCKDGSDERNCTIHPKRPDTINCSVNGFACGNSSSVCIPNSWVCDGEKDCPGGEDEKSEKCRDSTCAPFMFRCPSGKCIFRSWVCDGENDCSDTDSSDERNCTDVGHSKLLPRPAPEKPVDFEANSTCLDWMFKCGNGVCLPYWWRCDAINDCGDNSDEVGCGLVVPESSSVRPEHDATKLKCDKTQFTCSPGVCIPLAWVCDTAEDCADGLDERGCREHVIKGQVTCGPDETPCGDYRACVLKTQLCDGHQDCKDASDELACGRGNNTKLSKCQSGYVACGGFDQCVPQSQICNGIQECYDGSDEANCSSADDFMRLNQFLSIGVDQSSKNATSFLISCWMAQQKMVQYRFLPSISKAQTGVWKNMTWTNDSIYRFTGLEPFTTYNVTFYIQDSKSNKIYASNKYTSTATAEGVPTPPTRLTVRQTVGRRVQVMWDPPVQPRGIIKTYTVHYSPPIPPAEKTVSVREDGRLDTVVAGNFLPNTNYSFWMTARNGAYTSPSSDVSYLTYDAVGDVDDLSNVRMSRPNASTIILSWDPIRGVEGYHVQITLPMEYDSRPPIRTKDHNITLTNIPSGVDMHIGVVPYKEGVYGHPFTMPIRTDGVAEETLNLTGMLIKEKRTSVRLSWSRPTGERYKGKDLVYEVHYTMRLSIDGLVNATRIQTKETSMLIEGLHACEGYVFTVGLLRGPLAKPVEIITRENAKAPIKNLRLSFNADKTQLKIRWNANCDVIREPVAYRVDITEETRNKVSRYALNPTVNTTLEHVIENVPVGGRYNICVYASVPEAAVTCDRVRSRSIPPPAGVVAWQSPNGHVMVSWHHSEEDKLPDHKYEVIVSDHEIPDDLLQPTADMTAISAEFSPLLLTARQTASPLYVSVRAVTADGYYSDLSEVHTLVMDDVDMVKPDSSLATVWWGAGATLVIGVVLVAALVHLAMRHRRLARSFLRFTSHTPRYDSRRGQATIGDHDEDDVPPIHGFSDDEPLVIA